MGIYATVASLRDEAITLAEATDARLTSVLTRVSRQIDHWTGRTFEPVSATYQLDGDGSRVLRFSNPIISLTSLTLLDDTGAEVHTYSAQDFVVYNRHLSGQLQPDDREDSRIEMRSYYNQWPKYRGYLPYGQRNVKVVGKFGYTDYDGGVTPDGITPLDIAHACRLLALREFPRMGNFDERRVRQHGYRVSAETSEGANYVTQRMEMGSYSGDPEIDRIIQRYKRPMALGSV
jgi:hypothetical protein